MSEPKENELSKKIKSQKNEISKKKWNIKKILNLKKMKSQKKWNHKISEHNQCQCQIMSESR